MLKRSISQLVGGLLLLSGAFPATAASIQVSPVRVMFSAGQPVTALSVRNTGDEPIVMQLEVMSWSQQNGTDVYTPTRELLATPPIFTVPPGKAQVLRMGLRRPADAARELTYRLFLQEVPPPPKPGFQGLQMALRFGVPVFVAPATASTQPPVLSWRVYLTPDGGLEVGLANNGASHVRVSSLKLSTAGGKELAVQQKADYVLSGQTHNWPVKDFKVPSGSSVHISAQTDAGELDGGIVTVQPQ